MWLIGVGITGLSTCLSCRWQADCLCTAGTRPGCPDWLNRRIDGSRLDPCDLGRSDANQTIRCAAVSWIEVGVPRMVSVVDL